MPQEPPERNCNNCQHRDSEIMTATTVGGQMFQYSVEYCTIMGITVWPEFYCNAWRERDEAQ